MSEYIDKSSLYDRVFDRFEGEDLISKAEVLQMIANAPTEIIAGIDLAIETEIKGVEICSL